MGNKLTLELLRLSEKGIKGSLEKQDKVFMSSEKNRKLFEKAKRLAIF